MSENTSELRSRFWDDGYIIVDDVVSPDACDAFNRHLSSVISIVADEYVEGKRTELDFWHLLHTSRRSFQVMWNRLRLPKMLREIGRGPPRETDWEPFAARIGGLHLRAGDDRMRSLCHAERIVNVMNAILDEPVLLMSSIIYKQPGDAMRFDLHQDSSYLPSEPDTLVNAFLALDAMNEENGGLVVVPRSHKDGLNDVHLGERGFEPIGEQAPAPDPSRAICLDLKKGAMVFFHGRTWHGSGNNRSDGPRRSMLLLAMSRHSKMKERSWIQEPPGGYEVM